MRVPRQNDRMQSLSLNRIVERFERGQLPLEESLRQMRRTWAADPRKAASEVLAEPLLPPRQTALAPLQDLVGLQDVKRVLDELYSYVAVQALRKNMSLAFDTSVMHMVFMGRPGTGKTTIARVVGQMFRSFGVLSSGHVVEVERADLVGEYVGHTAQRTREQLTRARGGVLFVDEAYSLARGGERDFGREAIDTLVKGMEDRRADLVVILAGYEAEMLHFLNVNPGLYSRFPLQFLFADFTERELLQIAAAMLRGRDYRLAVDAQVTLRQVLRRSREHPGFSNARTVRNLIERAIRRHAARVIQVDDPTRADLTTLAAADFHEEGYCAQLSDRWSTQCR